MLNKKIPAIYGAFGGIISILFLRELVEALLVYLLTACETKIVFQYFFLSSNYDYAAFVNDFAKISLPAAWFVSCIILIEISSAIAKFNKNPSLQIGIIIFQIINITWIFSGLILFVISFIFRFKISSDWDMFLITTTYSRQQQLLVMFFFTFTIFIYTSFVFNRIKKYFDINE
jgi:hypothetical protein